METALRGITEVIEAVAAKGEQVTITGFAKFARVDRPARMARNPATGAPVKVKASKKAKITALKGFKDALMSPSAAPKLAKGVWLPKPVVAAPARTAPGQDGASEEDGTFQDGTGAAVERHRGQCRFAAPDEGLSRTQRYEGSSGGINDYPEGVAKKR